MLKPLQPGDVVEIIAPGFGATEKSLQQAVDYIESLGLKANAPAEMLGEDLLSATDHATRLRLLTEAFENPDSQAIWALKGGYGTSELIPEIQQLKPAHPKWLIGFSDITALHNQVHKAYGWPTLHAPVLWQIARDKVDKESINATEEILFGRETETRLHLAPLNKVCGDETQTARLREPSARDSDSSIAQGSSPKQGAVVKGGNMMLLQCSIGTDWQPNLDGAILLLEDIDETAYRIARVLNHLKQAGWFENIAAVCFGDFNYIDRKDDSDMAEKVIAEFAGQLTVPAYQLSGVGHTARNMPVLLNSPASITGNELMCSLE